MMTNLAQRHPVEGLGLEYTARECPNSPVIFVVRFYCSNEGVEYGFNFKFVRDETIIIITSLETTSSLEPTSSSSLL